MASTYVTAPIAPGPMVHGFAVTISDTTVFTTPTRALWVGVGGNLAVLMNGDATPITLLGVAAGTMLSLSVVKVMATNTTASSILGLY